MYLNHVDQLNEIIVEKFYIYIHNSSDETTVT